MCEYGPKDLEIVTIENYEKRIPVARENFRRAGREKQITLLEGDAGKILPTIEGSFDLIFMDPPYGKELERQVLMALSHSRLADEMTTIIVEASLQTDFSYVEEETIFQIVREKNYKTNKHVFIEMKEL